MSRHHDLILLFQMASEAVTEDVVKVVDNFPVCAQISTQLMQTLPHAAIVQVIDFY